MLKSIKLISLFLLLIACNQETNKQDSSKNTTAAPPVEKLPGLPADILQQLFEECTLIDYVFYDLPISMTIDQKPSIQTSLSYIANSAPDLKPECKPAGHITFQVNGSIALEADFYYSQGCTYYVFYKNKERLFANHMTQDGANSFGSLIQQGMQMRQGGNQ
jgi:hypothetical protein